MTPKKRTYINLINDFWERHAQEPLSAPASMVYFYLLNIINRNRWKPVFISNTELAYGARISRRGLPSYKAEIANSGLLCIQDQGEGRMAGTVYSLPDETAQKGADKLRNFAQINCAKKRSLLEGTAQKGTVNRAKLRSLKPATHINIDNKTYIRPSTTTEDSAQALNVVVEVEAEEVEILEDKKATQITGAAELLKKKKKIAAAQGAEVLKAFFDPSNQKDLETLCMQNYVSPEQLRGIAERIVADWTQDGETHDDYKGNFNIGAAVKHLRRTIPKKAAAEARAAARPKTRDEHRRELMDASARDFYEACQKDLAGAPRQEDNFDPPF